VDRLRLTYLRLRLQSGQTMAEYAILLGVIALVVLVAGLLLGSNITSVFRTTAGKL
jgi:Flp pilus assembly pilin Flp